MHFSRSFSTGLRQFWNNWEPNDSNRALKPRSMTHVNYYVTAIHNHKQRFGNISYNRPHIHIYNHWFKMLIRVVSHKCISSHVKTWYSNSTKHWREFNGMDFAIDPVYSMADNILRVEIYSQILWRSKSIVRSIQVNRLLLIKDIFLRESRIEIKIEQF